MNRSTVLGVLGALIIIAGVFTPVEHLSIFGDQTFMETSQRLGYVLIASGVLALLLIVTRQGRWAWFPGATALLVLIVHFFRTQANMSNKLAALQNHPGITGDNLTVHFQWG